MQDKNKNENGMSESEIGELIALAKAGESKAFEKLYHQHEWVVNDVLTDGTVFATVADREELLQEAPLAFWCAVQSYDPARGTLASLARACIRNAFIDRLRRLKKDRAHLSEDEAPDLASPDPDPATLVAQEAAVAQCLERLHGTLSELELCVLKLCWEGLTYKEIAHRLGKDVGAVTNALYRAREKAKKVLRPEGESGTPDA